MPRVFTSKFRRLEFSIFALVTSVSLLFFGGHSTSIDEETYLAGLRSFLRGRSYLDLNSVSPQSILAMPGKSGQLSSFYGIGTTIFFMPGYLTGRFVSVFVDEAHKEQVLRLFLYSTNSFALGLTALVIYKLCRLQNCTSAVSLWASLTFSFCTFALPSAGTGFSETFTALFVISALYYSVKTPQSRKILYLTGLLLGCAILMRASATIFLPIFLISLWVRSTAGIRIRSIMFFSLGSSIPIVIFLAANYWKFGSPLDTGYPDLAYNTPIPEGLYGLFISSGKGLLWFAPISALAFVTMKKSFANAKDFSISAWMIIAANALFFSRFEIWSGDAAYGPRYMGIVLPLFSVLAALGVSTIKDWSVVVTTLAGIPASLSGALIYVNASNSSRVSQLERALSSSSKNIDGEYNWEALRQLTLYIPRQSQLSYQFSQIGEAVSNSWNVLGNPPSHVPFNLGNGPALSWYMAPVRLDMWWVYWIESGAPKIFLGFFPLILISAVFFALRIRRGIVQG